MLDLSFSSNGHSSDAHKRIMSQFICTKKVVSCINTSSVLALVQCECHAGKKMLLQEINQFNRNWDADFRFSTNFWFLVQLPGGGNARFPSPAKAMKVSHRISLKKTNVLEKISSDLETLVHNKI